MWNSVYLARGPLAAFIAEGICWGAFAAVVPALKLQSGLTDGDLGSVMLIGAMAAFVAMSLSPRFEPVLQRAMMPVLALIMAGGFLLVGPVASFAAFGAAVVVMAIGSSSLDVAMNARISVVEASARHPLMNFSHGVFSLFYAISAICSGFARGAGANPGQIFSVVAALVLALALIMWLAPVSVSEEGEGQKPLSPWRGWSFLAPLGLVVLVGFMAEQATEGWSALHLERNHDATAALSALGPAILGLTMAFGRFSGQILVQRFDERPVLQCAAALSAIGAVIAAWSPGLIPSYLGFGLLGLGVSVIAPMGFAWAGRSAAPGQRPQAISRVASLGYTGFFIGPPLMGLLSESYGLSVSFTSMALALLLVPLVLVPWAGRASMRQSDPAA